ncbi:MAG: hypothetical protein JSW03_00965 [Candidatus Eiseniibacteriota bacterium]|nr:MAG: hypothetical protein JSW03_00965 [Candidatus Eisenbacteria bacterium]
MAIPLTVVCTLIGDKWHPVWVHRLHRMVEEHCSIPFDFRVITDRPEAFPEWGVPFSRPIVEVDGVWTKPDRRMMMNIHKPQGCWGKLDSFILQVNGPIIHLDLDCVILDDIAPLIRKNLHMPWQGDKFNGSVYSFTPDEWSDMVYPQVIPYREYPRGEQEYVVDAYPGKVQILHDVYSYKIHVASKYGKQPPEGARIVYFHGYPTPATEAVQDLPWINRTWRGLPRVERV